MIHVVNIFSWFVSCILTLLMVILGLPGGSDGKEFACNAGDLDSIPGLGRPPGEGKVYLLQYSGLENSMDSIVHGIAKSQTRLSFTFTFKKWKDRKTNR